MAQQFHVCLQFFFLITGLRLLNRLSPDLPFPLATPLTVTPGCWSTLSSVVFFMAAGEMRSWSARNCSSLTEERNRCESCHRTSQGQKTLVDRLKAEDTYDLSHRVLIQEASTALIRRLRKPPLSRKCRAWMVAPPGEHTLSFSCPGCCSESSSILAAPWRK